MPQSQETFCQLLESASASAAAAEGGERKFQEQTFQGKEKKQVENEEQTGPRKEEKKHAEQSV